eukprot:scaffold66190_cov27-Prasinocladus_malaysianus.AAC.1
MDGWMHGWLDVSVIHGAICDCYFTGYSMCLNDRFLGCKQSVGPKHFTTLAQIACIACICPMPSTKLPPDQNCPECVLMSAALPQVGGGPWWAAWEAKAEMTAPLRALVGLPGVEEAVNNIPGPLRPPGL